MNLDWNIKVYIKEMTYGGMDRIYGSQNRDQK